MPHFHNREPPEPTRRWSLVFCLRHGTVRGHHGGNAAKRIFYDVFLEELEACGMRLAQAGMDARVAGPGGLRSSMFSLLEQF